MRLCWLVFCRIQLRLSLMTLWTQSCVILRKRDKWAGPPYRVMAHKCNLVSRLMDCCGSKILGELFIFFFFLIQLPPIFNISMSQLQCYGESVYSVNNDTLSRCANGGTPLERITSVVAWSISTLHPLMFGVAPFNPILGETLSCLKWQPECATRTSYFLTIFFLKLEGDNLNSFTYLYWIDFCCNLS